ncbi:MAG: hypothetical protein JNK87_11565 [Bryobacterales bacterium]|nr:hypothetical protein [Bryobacterales bacterium]
MLPRYDIAQSYDWNYDHAPSQPPEVEVAPCAGRWSLCGLPLNSPLGVPAGPLLNSRWIAYYAALGFDTLTYKTVRSAYRASYEPPNLLPVGGAPLEDEGGSVRETQGAYDSWAISFGMPSKDPEVWREDIGVARRALRQGQVLVVSVVASPQPGWTVQDVAADFARCARWAADAGAQIVEPNFSCPNVCTAEADIFLDPAASGVIAAAVRDAVPELPISLKVGLFPNGERMRAMVDAVKPFVNAIAATNSITAKVRAVAGEPLFDDLRRGIGGAIITERCLAETKLLAAITRDAGLELISVGGVCTAADVRARLAAGAANVQVATAAMIQPHLALRIRQEALTA